MYTSGSSSQPTDIRPEDIAFWNQAKTAIREARESHMEMTTFSVRVIAALRQLVQRTWNKERVVVVIEALAAELMDWRTPRPQMVCSFEIMPTITMGLLDANMTIAEAENEIRVVITGIGPTVRSRLQQTYPELYDDQAAGDTKSGDR